MREKRASSGFKEQRKDKRMRRQRKKRKKKKNRGEKLGERRTEGKNAKIGDGGEIREH